MIPHPGLRRSCRYIERLWRRNMKHTLVVAVTILCLSIAAVFFLQSSTAQIKFSDANSPGEQDRDRAESRERVGEKSANLPTLEQIKEQQQGPTVVLPLVHQDVSGTLEELIKITKPMRTEDGELQEDKLEELIETDEPGRFAPGPLVESFLQSETPIPSALVQGQNFEGPGLGIAGFSVLGAPPDTTMAVGPNHIVAWVNTQIMIFNKAGVAQLPAPGFVLGNTLWAAFDGGLCETKNRGDPLVVYDRVADRWVFYQCAFAVNGSGAAITPYLQCFAVTTGSNPAGPYTRYSYDFSAAGPGSIPEFNDYGKIGVWNDAYYVGYNMFQGSPAGGNNGAALCAYDRTKMIAGTAAAGLCAPITFYAGGAAIFPADNEGPVPPTEP